MNTIQNQKNTLPYSYHTFLLPFLWNASGAVSYGEFEKVISAGKRWVEEKWDHIINTNPVQSGLSRDEWRQRYGDYQYFTPAANDIMFNVDGKNNVRLYSYVKHQGFADMQYIIEKGSDKYILKLTSIRLKVYDTGVALLMISGENYDRKSLDDINAINEYGRRVNMPFLPVGNHVLCADRLSITVNGKTICDDFAAFLTALHTEPGKKAVSWNYIMKPVQYLLDGDGLDNGGLRVTTNPRKTDGSFMIKPCIDDRMFVCCLVRNDEFSKALTSYDSQQGAYCYLTGCSSTSEPARSVSDDLYKFISIETSLTCQSAVMRRKLLEAAVYDRWIDYGTVYGICQHSFMCVTGEEECLLTTPIKPFLSQMVEMAALTVVQRSYQLLLFDRVSAISEKFNADALLDEKQFMEIESLQAMYVKCQNQILLPQITVQEQGIELYAMLQNHLQIPGNKSIMDEQINNLRDVSNISHERMIRDSEERRTKQDAITQNAFNVLAVLFSLLSIVDPLENLCAGEEWWWPLVFFAGKAAIIVGCCCALFRKRK